MNAIGGARWLVLALVTVAASADGESAQSAARSTPKGAESAPAHASIDRVAVRYYAPETGGSGHPRFVSERMLAFEARLDALAEQASNIDPRALDGASALSAVRSAPDDRFVRAALDRHVAEDMLSALAVQSGTTPKDVAALADEERAALVERVGGTEGLRQAMTVEGIDDAELDALLRRRARAALYVDRALTPLLKPTDEQLREVFRTSANPFKNQPFEAVRAPLSRWFVEERLRAAETTFLQVARARVRIVVVPRAA